MRLGLGRARFTSEITHESEQLVLRRLHFGDHNLSCGIQAFRGRGVLPEPGGRNDGGLFQGRYSGGAPGDRQGIWDPRYSLKSLFRDDRRAILQQILNTSRWTRPKPLTARFTSITFRWRIICATWAYHYPRPSARRPNSP